MTWYRVHFRTKQIIVDGDAELERVKARKVPLVILVEPMKTYTCAQCGKVEAWLDSWRWYGSYQDLEDGKPIIHLCGDDCQERFALQGLGSGPQPKSHSKATPKKTTSEAELHYRERRQQMRHEPRKFEAGSWRKVDDAKRAANPRAFPKPVHPKRRSGDGWCSWCGKKVTEKGRRTWHAACLATYFLHTDLAQQYRHLVERDGERCGMCGGDGGRWVIASRWSADPIPEADEEGWGPFSYIRWQPELEVDHVIELWEVQDLPDDDRRPYFGPDNLWLLCKPCHKRKSAQAAARRAKSRLLASTAPTSQI